MKKIFLFVLCSVAAMLVSTSCRFAREDNPGDTVAANEFDPTIGQKAKSLHASADTSAMNSTVDSTDIFFVGDGSTKQQLQLVSYPSKRDTAVFSKARHIKVQGNADFGHVVRVGFYRLSSGDSIVKTVEEITL